MNFVEKIIFREDRFIPIEQKRYQYEGGSMVNKSTYFWIGFFSLCLVVITHASGGPAVMFGEFIGWFLIISVCALISSKVKRIFKKPVQ
jgi:uncharacterized membrane protein